MIQISSKDSPLERYAYFILGLACLIVGFMRIINDISAYFAVGTIPTIKGLLFTMLYLFSGVYGCYYWFRTRKKTFNKV